MAIPARRFKKRIFKKKFNKKPRRRINKKAGVNPNRQYATIVETLKSNDVFADQPYQSTFNLSQFFRATTIAKNFQYYRAKSVKWEYMPLYNTFQENNSVAAVGKPQFYFQMNRTQDVKFSSLTAAQGLFSIQCSGADPRPFVKNIEIVYRPNWCSPGLTALGVTVGEPPALDQVNAVYSLGSKAEYGWLPTPNLDAWLNPAMSIIPQDPLTGVISTADMAPIMGAGAVYNGHNMYIQQDNEPNVPVGKCILTVEWEFKGGKQLFAEYTSTQKEPVTA